jgi:[ribosomal protein S5]-alanine N-acetyltransferase
LREYGVLVIAHDMNNILYQSVRITLRRLACEDRDEFVELVNTSADFLHPWVYLPGTVAEFDKYLNRFDGKTADCIVICDRESGIIAGSVSVNDIIRGPYQRATLGYNSFAPSAGRGYMSEGLGLIVQFAFNEWGLHRLEADIQPENEASKGFASRLGFRKEGYAPGFILIEEVWRDHERWAITAEMSAALRD